MKTIVLIVMLLAWNIVSAQCSLKYGNKEDGETKGLDCEVHKESATTKVVIHKSTPIGKVITSTPCSKETKGASSENTMVSASGMQTRDFINEYLLAIYFQVEQITKNRAEFQVRYKDNDRILYHTLIKKDNGDFYESTGTPKTDLDKKVIQKFMKKQSFKTTRNLINMLFEGYWIKFRFPPEN